MFLWECWGSLCPRKFSEASGKEDLAGAMWLLSVSRSSSRSSGSSGSNWEPGLGLAPAGPRAMVGVQLLRRAGAQAEEGAGVREITRANPAEAGMRELRLETSGLRGG